ncbi:protein MEI2-like 4 isoform X3 [Asparagus officinalis]|uniref:protein MEI2-like 4 isoform X3 n=1 Tax=Asparagus officinalis TaxID=4686 RepID=UPI00098E710A|nr:protein MEI2-like 4 isoform X3 [Asparagus officinalis]
MPFDVMDQRQLSFFSEELLFPNERQVGFWKPESMPDHQEGMSLMSGGKSVSSSPMEKLRPIGKSSVEGPKLLQQYLLKDQMTKSGLEHHLVGAGKNTSSSTISWRANSLDAGLHSNLRVQPTSLVTEGNRVDMNGFQYENSLFSSSFSELLNRKLKLSSNFASLGQSVDTANSNFEEEEPLESLKEIEAQTIGNLLPDDDDLLSGVVDDIGCTSRPNCGDDIDDDIFCTGGGMELEGDNNCINASDLVNVDGLNDLTGRLNNPFAGEHPYGEHPSRTLFVRNINSNVEDAELKMLFEQYGDIRTLYTACKHRGFVMISYYDIRAARNAMRSLQNKPLRRRKLDIHFSIPKDNPSEKDINQGTLVVFNLDSSVSNDDLRQIFGVYGDIKEIRETPHKRHHKFIEFYDLRDADAALRALNRSDIAGKKIKLEPSRPGGVRRCSLMQQLSPELELEESIGCMQDSSPCSSPPGRYGSVPLGSITSGFDSQTVKDLHSAARGSISPLLDSAVHGICSSVPQNISSPVRVASVGNHINPSVNGEISHSLRQVKFGFQGLPNMHPHSLPEYHEGLSNGSPYNSSSAMPAMSININSRPGEGIDHRYIQRVGSGSLNSHSFEAFGAPGNGSCPVHGNQYFLNNSKAYPPHSAGPMIWGTSPSFMNSVPSHLPPPLHGIPRTPSHMLNTILPLHTHHVGSAPAVNPSLWERRQPYVGDSPDASTFHPGSLGSMGFSGSSPMHPLELAAHNIFPHSGGNCVDHVGIPSPQQRCHIFQGRNHMIPMPTFDVPSDRIRNRRSDSSANQADNKKQYELDVERIIRGEDSRTTLMIKNIPNKYTSKMLLAAIDEHHKGTYDFIYLPIDFKNKCNVGYAFINMIDPRQIVPFFQAFNGKKWEKFNSEKVASLAYARIQGKPALIAHFQNSSLMNEDKRCRPILFRSDGPNAGDQEPFPVGTNIRSRPNRARTYGNEEVSPSTSPNGTGFSNGIDIAGSIKDLE